MNSTPLLTHAKLKGKSRTSAGISPSHTQRKRDRLLAFPPFPGIRHINIAKSGALTKKNDQGKVTPRVSMIPAPPNNTSSLQTRLKQ